MASASSAPRRNAPRRPADAWWLRVRWDRVGRVSLLAVLAGVVLLYVGPATSYLRTWGEAKRQRAEVTRLERDHKALSQRQKALRDPRTLEREARKLGMVRPDERSYVILGLPSER